MPLSVLYLDDEPDLCDLFRDLIASEEVEVRVFTDAQSAIDAAWASPPDLAILDYRLPEMNGDTAAQRMPPAVPKYLVTGDITVAPTSYPFIATFAKPGYLRQVRELIQSTRDSRDPRPADHAPAPATLIVALRV
jgi:DNA-binding NtrC family response regulator